MKTKAMLAILMLITIKNFGQNLSSTKIKSDSAVTVQGQILYKEIINGEVSYLSVNAGKNLMRSSNRRWTIDTASVVPQKHSVWKSAGVGMVAGAVVGAILGAATANRDDPIYGYTVGQGAVSVGALGALLGGASGLIVGLIQNAASKKHH